MFYVNFPFCATGFAVIQFSFNLKITKKKFLMESLNEVDWMGSSLFIASGPDFSDRYRLGRYSVRVVVFQSMITNRARWSYTFRCTVI